MSKLPRLSTIAPGVAFTDALATGVFEAYGNPGDPLTLTDVLILLPTRRAVRSLTEAFGRVAEQRGMGTVLLPRIQPLGDVDEETLMLEGFALDAEADLDGPPAISDLTRAFELARLVARKMKASGTPATPDQCVSLAYGLARFIDTAHTERVSLEALDKLVPEKFAEHWQETITFLEIVLALWPEHLKAQHKLDPAERRDMLLGALAKRWRAHPPAHPVIAAGTTGSIPATADLLKVIAGLPQGHIVLPGLDLQMPTRAWDALEPSHPQFGLRALIKHMDAARKDIGPWPFGEADTTAARQRLIHEALRPSAATDEWIDTAKTLAQDDPTEGLKFLVAQHSGEEALAIALLLREAVETKDRTAALVTPDRTLARRVSAELKRFGLNIDDSAGLPLDQTPPAAFLLHLADAAAANWAPVPLLTLLKHPFFRLGQSRAALRAGIDAIERHGLRGLCLTTGLEALTAKLKTAREETKPEGVRRALGSAINLLDALTKGAAPFKALSGAQPLSAWIAAHMEIATALAADEAGSADDLWRGMSGEKLSELIASLGEAHDAPGAMTLADYTRLLRTLMARQLVRSQDNLHPRLSIWGPLEARLQQADLVILGGLTEGVWPADVSFEPWLSRPMRAALGLSSPERQVGLAAHDFAQLAASPEVVLSRADKVEGKPAVPSRWWLRLENLLKGSGLPTVEDLTLSHAHWARKLDVPENGAQAVEPPAPKPPIEARPRKLSVTQVQNWLRDPYSIYARYILNLDRLDEIDREPGPADRGNLLHDIMEDFAKAYPKDLPDGAHEHLIEIGKRHFAAYADMPQVLAVWAPRFERLVDWIIDLETKDRETTSEVIAEQSGELTFPAGVGDFTLRARADRFDVKSDGTLGIADYKTGTLPRKDWCETGLQPQLTLEAAMVARGAFGDHLKDMPVGLLRYIRLAGGVKEGEVRKVTETQDHTSELAEEAFENFRALIAEFDDKDRTYPSQPRPQFANSYGDYDHLARRLEWSVGGDGEGGGSGGGDG